MKGLVVLALLGYAGLYFSFRAEDREHTYSCIALGLSHECKFEETE